MASAPIRAAWPSSHYSPANFRCLASNLSANLTLAVLNTLDLNSPSSAFLESCSHRKPLRSTKWGEVFRGNHEKNWVCSRSICVSLCLSESVRPGDRKLFWCCRGSIGLRYHWRQGHRDFAGHWCLSRGKNR